MVKILYNEEKVKINFTRQGKMKHIVQACFSQHLV